MQAIKDKVNEYAMGGDRRLFILLCKRYSDSVIIRTIGAHGDQSCSGTYHIARESWDERQQASVS